MRRAPSINPVVLSLARSIRSLTVGEELDIEVWVSRTDAGARDAYGFAAAFVALKYNPALIAVDDIIPSGRFSVLADGQVVSDGFVSILGGCANLGEAALGADEGWVRVARPAARTTAPGTTRVVGGPNDEMHGVAVVGEFTNIDPGMIEFGHADLTVRGVRKPTNWIRGRR